jgi:hypothetical protein
MWKLIGIVCIMLSVYQLQMNAPLNSAPTKNPLEFTAQNPKWMAPGTEIWLGKSYGL